MSIYKKCDIRGCFGSELTVQHVYRLGTAVAAFSGAGTILVGGDGRISTPVLKNALITSLVEGGCRVVDLGMVSTPAFYFARRKLGIPCGIMVTASHNPAADNGFKVTLGELPVTPDDIKSIAAFMESGRDHLSSLVGSVEFYSISPEYLADLNKRVPFLMSMKVVVDCSNGMASQTAKKVWQTSGAQVRMLLDDIDGRFPVHAPNPAAAENLNYLMEAVATQQADLGICYDGDADRVAFVSDSAQVVSNDQVIVLFVKNALRKGPAPIVYDQKCSRIVPEAIRSMGGEPIPEQSGHTFIKTSFLQHHAPYAGEITGHHFFQQIEGDDGILASLIFANILLESHTKLSTLLRSIPEYAISPEIRIPFSPEEIHEVLAQIESQVGPEAKVDHLDGLRLEFPDGWCLIRPSVTEPVLTARVEGVDPSALRRIIQRICTAAPVLSQYLTPYQSFFSENKHDQQ